MSGELITHGFSMLVALTVMRIIEWWMAFLWGGSHKILVGRLPLEYVFDAVDLLMVLVFALLLTLEVWRISRGRS